MLTIILISIFAVVFVGALAVLYHSLSGKAEKEDMLEQVARLARAQERLNTRLEELEEQVSGQNAASFTDSKGREHKGVLKIDATCSDAEMRYPVDVDLDVVPIDDGVRLQAIDAYKSLICADSVHSSR